MYAGKVAVALTLLLWLDAGIDPARSQDQPAAVVCVPRPASVATPPPMGLPPQQMASDGSTAAAAPPSGQPVCPAGQIPATAQGSPAFIQQNLGTGAPAGGGSRPLKGNPLLRPQSAVAPPPGQPGGGAAPFAREFSEIYRGAAAPSPQASPSPAPVTCRGQTYGTDPTCYYYGSAGLSRTVMGGGMITSVDRPQYVTTGGPGHTLNEISVQGGTQNGNIVEIGWTVSTDQNHDADPHIFVFHWVNWNGEGYNCCGWVQFSNRYYPGQNVSALVGREIYVGYVLYNGNWWAWFDGEWLGYFPGTLWNDNYSTAAIIQWFGEVATNNGIPPQTQMGDGILPPPTAAAHMSKLCDVDTGAWTCLIRNEQLLSTPAAPDLYSISQTGYGDAHYGGPGR